MKRVLIITYYWLPSGKASLHFPLKVAKHLPSFGWQPVVLTTDDTFSQTDNSLDAPPVEVVRTKSYEPFNIYKRFTGKKKSDQLIASETISKSNRSLSHRISIWIRMNLFVPDARIGWYFSAVKAAKKIKVDAVISIGPPHSAHLIGKKISKKLNIPHTPIFIDSWTDIVYYGGFKRSKITLGIDNYLEKSVLQNAKAVIFVTQTMREGYQKKYPFLINKSHLKHWGYSEEDFKGIVSKKKQNVLVHAGNLFSYQNPTHLWEVLKERNISIKFIGTVDPEIKKSVEGLDVEHCGFLPYHKMLKEISEATFLLVCASEPRHIPGKLFEYLRTGKPIIAFGDSDEVKQILKDSDAGRIFGYNESGKEFFTNYKKYKTNLSYIKRFERKQITKELAEVL